MILTPWGIGLTIGSLSVWILLFRAVIPSFILLFAGESEDSRFQLKLEREEVLFHAIVRFALFYLIIYPFLLILTANELGKQIPGAMCAFGTFNANPFGFLLLFLYIITIFPCLTWVVLYSLDMNTETTPFRKSRRVLLLVLFILFSSDAVTQTLFLTHLTPQVITSCCAVFFDPTIHLYESPVKILSNHPQPLVFFLISALYLLIGVFSRIKDKRCLKVSYGFASPFYFFLCFCAITSFISPYIYALPHHHCPFCILKGKEAILGMPLTVLVFLGGLFGWASGIVELASKVPVLSEISLVRQRRFQTISFICFALFVAGSYTIIFLYQSFGEL